MPGSEPLWLCPYGGFEIIWYYERFEYFIPGLIHKTELSHGLVDDASKDFFQPTYYAGYLFFFFFALN